jgi:hypothetical protein
MTQSSIATAADYADAMLTARRAKNWLVLLLLLFLLVQLAIFFVMRYVSQVSDMVHKPDASHAYLKLLVGLKYLVDGIDFLGIALALVLTMVLGLIVGIMLVGRLIGVARVMSGFIWSLVLITLLFPWQSLLSNVTLNPYPVITVAQMPLTATTAPAPTNLPPDQDFKVPGVLYTWGEVTHPQVGATFAGNDLRQAILHWSRYLAFPLIALIILLSIQVRSSRGLRMALGEAEAADDAYATGATP